MSSRNPQPLSMQWNTRRPPPRPTTIPVLRVEVLGSEIVVTASDTDYVMTYHKPANSPQLLARSFPRKERLNEPSRLPNSCLQAGQRQGEGVGVDRMTEQRGEREYAPVRCTCSM
jgi:hypothetical protein